MLIETAKLTRRSLGLELYVARQRTNTVKDRIREINPLLTNRETDILTDKGVHRNT